MRDIHLFKRNLTILFGTIFFLALTTDSSAQNPNKHSISFEVSPLTYFYDGVSPFNTKDGLLATRNIPFLFRGRIRGSIGFGYGYSFNDKLELHTKFLFFQATGYSPNGGTSGAWNLLTRQYQHLGLLLRRNWCLHSAFSGFVDAGASLRRDRTFLKYSNSSNCVSCVFLGGHTSQDLSIDFRFGLKRQIVNTLYLNFSIANSLIAIQGAQYSLTQLENSGGSVRHLFPRFYSSLNFGLEYRFGSEKN